jgi:hypothetical protein
VCRHHWWQTTLNRLEYHVGIQMSNHMSELMFKLPLSRQMEYEADHIGTFLLSKVRHTWIDCDSQGRRGPKQYIRTSQTLFWISVMLDQ